MSEAAIGSRVTELVTKLEEEVSSVIVGQREVVRGVITALFAGGHVLLEGLPGLGKTLLVRTLAECLHLRYSRIQFTPDLMPGDIVGTDVLTDTAEGRKFSFRQGPVFANLLLADEINRATPRTQSAMLEAMAEHVVTVGGQTHPLPQPFFVLATQNPIDLQGTYPLPEAQLDRFFFKILVNRPPLEDLKEIARRTTGNATPRTEPVMNAATLLQLQKVFREVPISDQVLDYAARLIMGTHPDGQESTAIAKRYVRFGASPRAIQSLILAAKINTMLSGDDHVSVASLKRVAHPALRHRLVLNVEAQLQNVDSDTVLSHIMEEVRP